MDAVEVSDMDAVCVTVRDIDVDRLGGGDSVAEFDAETEGVSRTLADSVPLLLRVGWGLCAMIAGDGDDVPVPLCDGGGVMPLSEEGDDVRLLLGEGVGVRLIVFEVEGVMLIVLEIEDVTLMVGDTDVVTLPDLVRDGEKLIVPELVCVVLMVPVRVSEIERVGE